VDLSNTKWGQIEQTQIFTWLEAPSRAQRILRPGDTIVGTVRPGNGSYALVSSDGLTGSTGFAVLRPRQSEYREIVYLAATSRETIEVLAHLSDGAAYPAVRPDVVAARELVIADGRCLAAFSATVAPIIDLIEANKVENSTIAQLRDLLLPKLMSGEIRLHEAEKLVGVGI
jgi:type I restriction enzyme S subunit